MKNPNRRNPLNNSIDRKYIKRELKRKKYKKNLWVRIGELISIPLYYTFSFKGDTPASFHFVFPLKRRLCFLSPVKLVPLSTVKFPPFFLKFIYYGFGSGQKRCELQWRRQCKFVVAGLGCVKKRGFQNTKIQWFHTTTCVEQKRLGIYS